MNMSHHTNASGTQRRNPPRRARHSTSSHTSVHSPDSIHSELHHRQGVNVNHSHLDIQTAAIDNSHAAASPVVELSNSSSAVKNVIEVSTNVQIFRLQKIDSSSEEYCLDIGLTFIWVDPNLVEMIDGIHYSTHPSIVQRNALKHVENVARWPDDIHIGEDTFDPAWKILNSSDVNIVKSITTVLDASIGKVHNFVHVRATIDQGLDLHDFPFDKQKLTFRLQSEHPETCMKFTKFTDRNPLIFAGATSEWLFAHKSLPKIRLFNPPTKAAASGVNYASITAEFYALRKPEWYMWNVVFTSFAIVSSSFSLFFLEEDAKGERLSILFTTWLMLISLKFIISDYVPKIPYFSLLDYYITFSYMVMVFLIYHVCNNEKNDRVNYFAHSVSPLIKEPDMFVLVNLIWISIHGIVLWKYHVTNDWEVWHSYIGQYVEKVICPVCSYCARKENEENIKSMACDVTKSDATHSAESKDDESNEHVLFDSLKELWPFS